MMDDWRYDSDGIRYQTKTPAAVLDYKVDFAAETNGRPGADGDWLESGDTISTRTVTVDSGITKDSDALADSDTAVVVWLSGGTAGSEYDCTVQVVTANGRTVERTFRIKVVAER
jgi:hypothetical protein